MGHDWFVKSGSGTLGPLSSEELIAFVADSEAGSATEVCRGAGGPWVSASSVEGLLETGNPKEVFASTHRGSLVERDESTVVNPYRPATLQQSGAAVAIPSGAGGLKMTRAGLLTCHYGICFVLLGVVILGVSIAVIILDMRDQVFFYDPLVPLCQILAYLSVMLLLIGGIAFLVGQVLCLAAPIDSGARGLMKVVFSLHIVSLVLAFNGVGFFEFTWFELGDRFREEMLAKVLFSVLQMSLSVVGFVCFMAGLKKLALYLEQSDLASAATAVRQLGIALGGILLPALVGFSLVSGAAGVAGEWAVVAVGMMTGITALIALGRFSSLLVRLGRAIPKH